LECPRRISLVVGELAGPRRLLVIDGEDVEDLRHDAGEWMALRAMTSPSPASQTAACSTSARVGRSATMSNVLRSSRAQRRRETSSALARPDELDCVDAGDGIAVPLCADDRMPALLA